MAGLVLLGAIVLVLAGLAYGRGGGGAVAAGLRAGAGLFVSVLPQLLLGFTLAGLLVVLLPEETIVRWLGARSGWRGIAVAWVAGSLTPGGPFTHFPILASLMARGVALPPLCTYLAAWGLVGVHRLLVWEVPLMGWRFALLRLAASVLAPPAIGLLALGLETLVRRS